MTKPLPEKFEDWTPPWGDGEIDADKVAKLLFNSLGAEQTAVAKLKEVKSENAALTTTNEELERANEVFKKASEKAKEEHSTDVQKAVAEAEAKVEQADKRVEEANAKVAEKTRENDLLQVRVKFPKIDDEDIDRLKGDDLEALLEDAEKFAEKHGLVESEGDPDDDNDGRVDDDIVIDRQTKRKRNPGDPNPDLTPPGGDLAELNKRIGASALGW